MCVMATTTMSAIDAETVLQAQELVQVGTWVADFEPAAVPDLENCEVRWSDVLWHMMRINPHTIPLRFDTLMDYVHADDRERLAHIIGVAAGAGIGFHFDYRVVRADGVERVLHARGSAQCDSGGRLVRLLGTVSDITDRVRAEQARAETDARFRAVFEQSAVGMLVAGTDLRLLSVNESFATLLGYEPAALVGRSLVDITHPDDVARSFANGDESLLGPATYEKRYLDAKGNAVWGRVTVTALRDATGAHTGFLGLVEDISARRMAADALARQTEILKGILDHLPVMVVQVDSVGRLSYTNREACRVFGWARDEEAPPDILASTFPNSADRARVSAAIAAGDAKWLDFDPVAKDGRVVPSSWASIKLSSGGALMIGQDLSERRDMQQRLAQSQKMEALGQLAGGVAHDFNNILTIVMACATFIKEAAVSENSVKADAQEILTASERATGLTRQLLAFSRRQILQPECVDVNAAVKSLAKTMHRLIGENIQIAIDLNAERPNIEVDRTQLEQVILNLAVNARDAIREHGTITLATRNSVDAAGREHLVLCVRDDGVGIEPSVRQRIFEPFFTTKPIGKGTGLGLATVHGIVAQSGGSIELDSAPGKGTEFRILLPSLVACERPNWSPTVAAVVGGSETVLLVEDETAVRVIARRMLTSLGYQVIEARHGKDALELAAGRGYDIDLLISDVVMPEMGGRELASELRTRCTELPVLLTSGYTDDELLRKGILDPGYKVLRKPFTKDDLASAVRVLLDERSVGAQPLPFASSAS
jgi:two-component system cell cycle sensor histidine kinase/response regulator CckA